MKALITAGGRGTRLRPITYSMNKHLIPLANKPMIFYAIEKVAEAGITEVAININEGDVELPFVVGDGSRWGVQITYIEQQGGALGLSHIIKNAEAWLGDDSFIFYLGDNIILGSITPFIRAFEKSEADAYLALSEVSDPQRFGVPEINAAGEIVRVIEKPADPPSNYAVTGIYCYSKKIHDAVNAIQPSARGELEISDAHTYIINNGGIVKFEVVEGWWKDTGKPEDLLECNRLLLEGCTASTHSDAAVEAGVVLHGEIAIAEDVQILGKTSIHGPVVIGRGAIIRDSVIGPYTAIGKETEVSGAHIENSIIMDEADITSSSLIVESIIGHNATIQNARTTPERSHRLFVGENSIVEL